MAGPTAADADGLGRPVPFAVDPLPEMAATVVICSAAMLGLGVTALVCTKVAAKAGAGVIAVGFPTGVG